jgi:DNA-3-methyladenine glycosylase
MPRVLKLGFFDRPADVVAADLVGHVLVRHTTHGSLRGRVVETEAYVGPHDLACHAAKGRTKRTEVMFGPAGHIYMYFVYGMHWMLNIVTGPKGYPAAVLIRGLDVVSGPARLTKAFELDGSLYGRPAAPESGLWFEDGGRLARTRAVVATPRIGIDYAGPAWIDAPLRFVLKVDEGPVKSTGADGR